MKVSVVIPNYNGIKFLEECFETLRSQTYIDFETIMVDNGSSDASLVYTREHYPEVSIIALEQNLGFSAAVNKGILQARGSLVVLLNTDVAVETDWLENLVACISSDDTIFSCSSKMIQYANRSLIDDAGDEYTLLGWAYQVGHAKNVIEHTTLKEVFSSCAGAAIYRKDVLLRLGGFDEAFFAYLEDVDVGFRASIEGYRNVYCPSAIVYHVGSATSGGGINPFKVKLSARNNVYLIYKNYPGLFLLINIAFLSIGVFLRFVSFNKPLREAYWSGLVEGIRTLHRVQRTSFRIRNFPNYCRIQYRLLKNTFVYFGRKLIEGRN